MTFYLATALIPYEGENIIGAYSTFEAACPAALESLSCTWYIAKVYELELDTNKKSVIWQEEKSDV